MNHDDENREVVEDALEWADGKTMSAKSDYVEVYAMTLAQAYRAVVAEILVFQSGPPGPGEGPHATNRGCNDVCRVIPESALLARAEAAEQALAASQSHDRCNAGMRSRIKSLEEALRAYKKYGKHKGSCVQMTGKTCSCGFDDTATRAGGLATLHPARPAGEKEAGL